MHRTFERLDSLALRPQPRDIVEEDWISSDDSPVAPMKDNGPAILMLANNPCAHSSTHGCPYLADSSARLCRVCSTAQASGQSCG